MNILWEVATERNNKPHCKCIWYERIKPNRIVLNYSVTYMNHIVLYIKFFMDNSLQTQIMTLNMRVQMSQIEYGKQPHELLSWATKTFLQCVCQTICLQNYMSAGYFASPGLGKTSCTLNKKGSQKPQIGCILCPLLRTP